MSLGTLFVEAGFCRGRINDRIASETTYIHTAIADAISPKSGILKRALDKLTDGS